MELEWAPYHCGEMLQILMVDLVREVDPQYDIYRLWQDIFAVSRDMVYGSDDVFEAWKRAYPGLEESVVLKVKALFETKGSEVAQKIREIRD